MAEEQSSPLPSQPSNQDPFPRENFLNRLRNQLFKQATYVQFRPPKYTRDREVEFFLHADKLISRFQPMKHGLDDGRKNYPPVDIRGEAVFESKVKGHCDDAVKRLSRQAHHQLITLNNQQAALDIGPSFGHDIDRVKVAAEQDFKIMKDESLENLKSLRRSELEHERDYRHFRNSNELHRKASPEHPASLAIGILVLMILFEGGLNALIFQQLYNYGYAGGFLIALMIGVINVVFCFFFGKLCVRNTIHVSKTRRRWGYILTFAICFFLIFVHYTLGRARAFIETHGATGLQNIYDQPVDWTFLSFLLVAMGIFFSATAILEGCLWSGDMYPGFSAITKSRDHSIQLYATARKQLSVDAQQLIFIAKQNIDGIVAAADGRLLKYTGILHEVGATLRLFNESVTQMESSCNRVLMIYREANQRVRTQEAPGYFLNSYAKLDRDIGTDVEDASGRLTALNHLVDQLKIKAEKAKNELQVMLAGQLRDLDEALAAIDATVLPLVEGDPSAPDHAAKLTL